MVGASAVIAPGQGWSGDRAGTGRIAPRDQRLPLREPTTAADHHRDDRAVPEHALHPRQRPVDPLVGTAAPQPVDMRADRIRPGRGSAGSGRPVTSARWSPYRCPAVASGPDRPRPPRLNQRGCSHSRSWIRPDSVPTSTRRVVQTSPSSVSRTISSSATARTANATWSTRSTGGSKSSVRVSSGGIAGPATGRSSSPTGEPMGERAVRTEPGQHLGRGATARTRPATADPSRRSRSVSTGCSSVSTESGARNSGEPPAGSPAPGSARELARAACSAANGPSAIPIRPPGTSYVSSRSSSFSAAACLAAVEPRSGRAPSTRTSPDGSPASPV